MNTKKLSQIKDRGRTNVRAKAGRHAGRIETLGGDLDGRQGASSSIASAAATAGAATVATHRLLRIGARMIGYALNGRLANGEAPDASRLLAERAQYLVSPGVRDSLTRNWADLLNQADVPVTRFDARVPVVRERVVESEAQIREMIAGLMAPLARARGVAMSQLLLCDGAGPLFNRQSDDLDARLRAIVTQLDPATA
jgi:hypothetical protein